jgi:Formylglycine-generating sulfatase enzyme.
MRKASRAILAARATAWIRRSRAFPKRVQKGGSFLCSDQYCARYHVGSRGRGAADSGGTNVGFRCGKPA